MKAPNRCQLLAAIDAPAEPRRLCAFMTPLGGMALAAAHGAVVRLTLGHASADEARQILLRLLQADAQRRCDGDAAGTAPTTSPALDLAAIADALLRYAAGERVDLTTIPVDAAGCTDFQSRVLQRCRAIPYGRTSSYGELAAAVGHPQAARAVGGVMARNRVPLLIPCHRVVGAQGRLGGFSAPTGVALKQQLLALETQADAGIVGR
jgi:methylated-DNA-[protein]-cysteine S-methyltransferase